VTAIFFIYMTENTRICGRSAFARTSCGTAQAAIVYAQKDRLEYVRMLLEAGSEVNHRDEANHNSLLNLLIKSKRLGKKVCAAYFVMILFNRTVPNGASLPCVVSLL